MSKNKFILLLTISAILFIGFIKTTFAQISSSGIAITAPVSDEDALSGDIICTYTDGNARCKEEYDAAIFGVISDNPAASLTDSEIVNGRLVVTSGITNVRVSSANGNIAEGDFITSSISPG